MNKNNSNIDYQRAMKDLLTGLKDGEKTIRGNSSTKYAFAYGQVSMAIKMCLVVCTDMTFDDIYRETNPPIDDIPSELFKQSKT